MQWTYEFRRNVLCTTINNGTRSSSSWKRWTVYVKPFGCNGQTDRQKCDSTHSALATWWRVTKLFTLENLTRGRTDHFSNISWLNFRLAVTYLQFPVQFFFSAILSPLSLLNQSTAFMKFFSCDLKLWPMIVIFELGLYSIKLNKHPK